MSTSLLYHGLGIRGYNYLSTTYLDGDVIFKIYQDKVNLRCSECNSRELIRRGTISRRFLSLPIGNKSTYINFDVQRVECCKCKVVRQVKIGFADTRRSYTKSFERYVLELSQYMTINDIAKHLCVGWDTIKDIQKRNLNKKYARPKLKKLKYIAIDEISVGKGHKYLTLIFVPHSNQMLVGSLVDEILFNSSKC